MALSALTIFAYLEIGKKIMALSALTIFAYLEIGKKNNGSFCTDNICLFRDW